MSFCGGLLMSFCFVCCRFLERLHMGRLWGNVKVGSFVFFLIISSVLMFSCVAFELDCVISRK